LASHLSRAPANAAKAPTSGRDIGVATGPTGTPGRRWREAGASLFIAAFLLPNLTAVVRPYESFPYTSAPMFAHYVGPQTPRYRLRMTAETADGGRERELRAADLGLNGIDFTRYFFGTVYGSVDPYSPFGNHPGDDRAAFEARVGSFFDRVTTVLRRRDPAAWERLARVRLEAVRLTERNHDGEARLVGHYDVASHRFVHRGGASATRATP
jgi:hypothetical protein